MEADAANAANAKVNVVMIAGFMSDDFPEWRRYRNNGSEIAPRRGAKQPPELAISPVRTSAGCAPAAGKSTLNRLELSGLEPTHCRNGTRHPPSRFIVVRVIISHYIAGPVLTPLSLRGTDVVLRNTT